MRSNLPKVLMLGWEFPPIINGGLGVACHDLSCAMSDLSDITMVVPKACREFKVKNVNLIGVNNVDVNRLAHDPFADKFPFKMHFVPANLDPYFSENSQNFGTRDSSHNNKFDIDNLYGGDVIKKVSHFSEITASMATYMDFDIIHAHDWMTMLAGMKIKEKTGKPLVMHIHSLEVDRSGAESKGWVYQLEKKGMEYADLLMPVSNFTATNIEQYYGINKNKMSVIHNGSNIVEPFKSKRPFKEKTVLFVGRLTRQKGPEKFLDIASKVLEINPDVRFIMAGAGDYFRSMIEQSSYKHIGNRFHLTGFLDQEKLKYLFSISDVYCMPSVSEPFGLSAVEAAQFGIPCVISKQSGVSEVLHGALKFDFWDVNKAADGILNLLKNPVLSKKVTEDAASDLKKISWDISARKIIEAYSANNLIN
jgi:glycogen synthase